MARQKYAVALIKAAMSTENNSFDYVCGMLAMALELKKITQAEYWQLKKLLDGREEYNALHRGQGDYDY